MRFPGFIVTVCVGVYKSGKILVFKIQAFAAAPLDCLDEMKRSHGCGGTRYLVRWFDYGFLVRNSKTMWLWTYGSPQDRFTFFLSSELVTFVPQAGSFPHRFLNLFYGVIMHPLRILILFFFFF